MLFYCVPNDNVWLNDNRFVIKDGYFLGSDDRLESVEADGLGVNFVLATDGLVDVSADLVVASSVLSIRPWSCAARIIFSFS